MYGTLSYIHKVLFVPICTRLLNNNVEDIYTLRGGSRSTIAGGGAPIYIYIYAAADRGMFGWGVVQSTKCCRAGGGYGRGVCNLYINKALIQEQSVEKGWVLEGGGPPSQNGIIEFREYLFRCLLKYSKIYILCEIYIQRRHWPRNKVLNGGGYGGECPPPRVEENWILKLSKIHICVCIEHTKKDFIEAQNAEGDMFLRHFSKWPPPKTLFFNKWHKSGINAL